VGLKEEEQRRVLVSFHLNSDLLSQQMIVVPENAQEGTREVRTHV
jgi:hypothetical protein